MERRRDPKALPQNYQERRISEALEKQKQARSRALSRSRELLLDATAGAEQDHGLPGTAYTTGAAAAASSETAVQRRTSTRQYWAQQLMLPEWLIEVPPDLGSQWYVLPRPEGQRCLVVAAQGQTIARLRSGILFERFTCELPAGGPGGQGGEHCILDCIYHMPNNTYYVLDVMSWRGHDLYDCTTEFRLFWGHSKLAEVEQAPPTALQYAALQQQQQQEQERRFAALPAYEASQPGLRHAYSDAMPFTRDGLYFLHRQAQYAPGQTPLALQWKDAASSRYFLDTDAAGVPLEQQRVVLQYRMDRSVATGDDPPAVLATMPSAFVQQMGPKLKTGRMLKFVLGPGGVHFHDGRPAGADLHFEGAANQRRGHADMLSKVLFQMMARTHPVTIEALLQAAAAIADGTSARESQAQAGLGSIAALPPQEADLAGFANTQAMAEDAPAAQPSRRSTAAGHR